MRFQMRNRSLGLFVALLTILVLVPALRAGTGSQAAAPKTPAARAQPADQYDISGIWRMLAPGQTRARAQTVGAGAFHPTFGPDRPPMTAWGKAKWSQTKPSAQRPPLAYVFLPDQKDWNDPLFVCDPAGYPR